MFNRLKIGTKVVMLVLSLVVVAVIAESIVSIMRNRKTVDEHYLSTLNLVSQSFDEKVDVYIQNLESEMTLMSRRIDKEDYLVDLQQFVELGDKESSNNYRQHFRNEYFSHFMSRHEFLDFYILDKEGKILFQNSDMDVAHSRFKDIDTDDIKIQGDNFQINRASVEVYKGNEKLVSYVCSPLWGPDGQEGSKVKAGIIVGKLDAGATFGALTPDSLEIGQSFQLKAFKSENELIYEVSGDTLLEYSTGDKKNPVISAAKNSGANNKGQGKYKDLSRDVNLAVWNFNSQFGIGVVAQIKLHEVRYNRWNFNLYTIIIGMVIIAISLILSIFFSRLLSFPILKLKKVLGLVSNGVLPKELKTPLEDEIGAMINIVNNIVKSLKKTAAFATRIGEGDFATDFQPISNKDTLGQALVNMRSSLQQADKRDHLRNWIVTGVAEIGEILRNNDTLEKLGDQILEYICHRVGAVQGGFYAVNEDENGQKTIDLKAIYAYEKKKHLKATFKFGEGLVGQAAVEEDVIMRTEIPDDYMRITSGLLGESVPKCLLVVPLITNEMVYGVIELASFEKFDEGQSQFMSEVSEIIARTVFNITVNENTKRLLGESQRMSQELQVQQSELQKNAVDMEQNQIDLNQTNTKLEHQISEVNNAQKRIQALLQNASEIITIYESDGVVRFVSPSVTAILGYKEEDLIGIKDLKFVDEQFQKVYTNMFTKLIENEKDTISIQIPFFKKTGDKIWLEATGKNMLSDAAIKGIVVNSRDITERRRAEEEERKRGQMQALSENSIDLIMRLGLEGDFFYVNPAIRSLTGQTTEFYKEKNIKDVSLPESVVEAYMEVVAKVGETNQQQGQEIHFSSMHGDRIMQVNAMPETDPNGDIETVLLVSHDITERKEIENEIVEKNNKINDSINYAEHIQEAILPDNDLIKDSFKESFIYFLPRDVVSGDFPWFYRHGNDVYIAAVDCTGHGVPGAMISLVGYFLLNNIVNAETKKNAGEILDDLDHLVTSTFKQNLEASKIKDGMDLAFCKVDLDTNTLEYAGANRPLYVVNADGEFSEVKGNKFPIGGGLAYDNKTNFTNTKLTMGTGDSVFFFSDGFPDQFGGENNTKFGPRRIKQLIEDNKTKPLDDIHQEFDKQFKGWQGEGKQTDDVLLIGIRF